MIDILPTNEKKVLTEIIAQGIFTNITLQQTLDIARDAIIAEAEKQVQELINQGKAADTLKKFQLSNPDGYAKLKQAIEDESTNQ